MASQKEIEARWINLDPETVRKNLVKIGAVKTGSYFFREWIFSKPEWKKAHKRIRIRTDGQKTWVTIKTNETFTVDSTHEVEMEVSSAEKALEFIKATGLPLVRSQEKKREKYALGDIVIDLDFWPKIPMVLEIEAPTEIGVRKGAELLGLKWDDAIFVDQYYVHRDYYGIDLLNDTGDYLFDK